MKELGIYIHFPFCKKICSYCDFVVDNNLLLVEPYLKVLREDIERTSKEYFDKSKYTISTIYFGGGTPSIMTPLQLESVVKSLYENFDLSELKEFSIESNPNSLSYDKMMDFKSFGINRISIGVQSFNKHDLGLLQRSHSPKGAIKAIEDAKKVGFSSINLDLIFSVPNQTKENWLSNLEIATSLETDHISCYNLTYEKGTPLYNKMLEGLVERHSDEFDSEEYLKTAEFLESKGFVHYEVSNYAKYGKECKHNLDIWENNDYLGFGVGAHWKYECIRYENTPSLPSYLNSFKDNSVINKKYRKLSEKEILEEYVMLGLRAKGINIIYLETSLKRNLELDKSQLLLKLISEDYLIYDKINKQGLSICRLNKL